MCSSCRKSSTDGHTDEYFRITYEMNINNDICFSSFSVLLPECFVRPEYEKKVFTIAQPTIDASQQLYNRKTISYANQLIFGNVLDNLRCVRETRWDLCWFRCKHKYSWRISGPNIPNDFNCVWECLWIEKLNCVLPMMIVVVSANGRSCLETKCKTHYSISVELIESAPTGKQKRH